MTDLDKLKKTFDELGIVYKEENQDEETIIMLDEGGGYIGFGCDFHFINKKFIEHKVWE